MPRGDRRGPVGAGPMSGRVLGYCAGNDQPGFTANAAPQGAACGPEFRRGVGRGRRMGYGRSFLAARVRRADYEPAVEAEEDFDNQENKDIKVTRLENLANTLTSELEIVKKQIDELKNE